MDPSSSLALDMRPRERRGTAVHAWTALVVVTCTLLLLGARAGAGGALGTKLDLGPESQARAHVLVVFQAEDCDSRMSYLEVFGRPALRSRFGISGLVLGSEGELRQARTALEQSTVRLPLRRGARADRVALAALGYRQTPLLVVIDRDRHVRLTAPLPRSREEGAGLTQLLESLARTL